LRVSLALWHSLSRSLALTLLRAHVSLAFC
jgi:hypothetical protein